MVPAWFNASEYLQNKLNQLGSGWDYTSFINAFENAGYSTNPEDVYRHFVEYGNKENVSPNSYFKM